MAYGVTCPACGHEFHVSDLGDPTAKCYECGRLFNPQLQGNPRRA